MSVNRKYYWLKLKDDFFSSVRIKKLRKLAGGDTYTIIYLKMQMVAMKNEGIITFTGLESDFAEELALEIDEAPDDVRVTLSYLLSCGLAESSDNVNFLFPYAIENTGSDTTDAINKRLQRARIAAQNSMLNSGEGGQCPPDVHPLSSKCPPEIEKDIRDKREEIEKDRGVGEGKETPHAAATVNPFPYDDYLKIFCENCPSLPKPQKVESWTEARKKALRSKKVSREEFRDVCKKIERSDFLSGRSGVWAGCSLDWILKPANWQKIVEGNYDNRGKQKSSGSAMPDYSNDPNDADLLFGGGDSNGPNR